VIRLPDDLPLEQPPLLWQPCRESLSPFYPFYVPRIPATQQLFYIRTADGEAFPHLTTDEVGL
jgi:hypothetical protein